MTVHPFMLIDEAASLMPFFHTRQLDISPESPVMSLSGNWRSLKGQVLGILNAEDFFGMSAMSIYSPSSSHVK